MSASVRLVPGQDCWWALAATRAARLPPHAVTSFPTGPPGYWDEGRRRGLTAESANALEQATFFEDAAPSATYALTVLTATTCNLGCAYCFQNVAPAAPGSFAPPRIGAAVLTAEGVRATVRFTGEQMTRHGKHDLSLLLFGGEPLLNIPGCTQLLRGLRPLRLVSSEIVTNGVLLTLPVAQDLHEEGLTRVQISFDGHRLEHDQVRVTRNGRATYDTILRNIEDVVSAVPQLSWNLRVNVSHRNLHGLSDLVDDLASLVADAADVTFHLALIDDTGLGYDNEAGYSQALADTFVAVNRRAILAGMRVPFSRPLSDCPYCSIPGGGGGAVVNADGALYSCWESAGRDGWDVGSVTAGYLPASELQARWVACDFDALSHGDDTAVRAFFDVVDAAALDDQYRASSLAPAHGR